MTKEIVDFTQWAADLTAIGRPFDDQVRAIAQRDTQQQEEVARRGGAQIGSLLEESQRAVDRVLTNKREALARALTPRLQQLAAEHAKRIRETLEPIRLAADGIDALNAFERAMNDFLGSVGHFHRPVVADPELSQRAQYVAARARAVLAPPAIRPAPLPALAALDFSDVAS